MSPPTATVLLVLVFNTAIFTGVASPGVLRLFHHHWVFPIFSVFLAGQYAVLQNHRISGITGRFFNAKIARTCVLWCLVFLLAMGIVRHVTIFSCFANCPMKVALACLPASAVFVVQANRGEASYWNTGRAGLAALGLLLWSVYLALAGLGAPLFGLNVGFLAFSLFVFWLGKSIIFRILALAVVFFLAIRFLPHEWGRILLSLAVVFAALNFSDRKHRA